MEIDSRKPNIIKSGDSQMIFNRDGTITMTSNKKENEDAE